MSSDSDFAADLSHVVRGTGGPAEYADPARFFANTYPTRGLKNLMANVCARLSGRGSSVAAVFRLDTSFGGGKTHGLIALVHAAAGMKGVANPAEFLDPALIPAEPVAVAAFDGENADPSNGRRMADGTLAFTPWGEIAYALAGPDGYKRVRNSDIDRTAPGAETLRELFGDRPVLVVLDELSIYLRKVWERPQGRDQLTAFLTSLFKAVEASPRAALVYAFAIGKTDRAGQGARGGDAYSSENVFIADRMAEAESVSARKATLLNPTEDDETVQVLRRRLFARVDMAGAEPVLAAYQALWAKHRDRLSPEAANPLTLEAFRASYPLHPDLLATFTGKTATLAHFQRVRGMLRILGRTVAQMWAERPKDAAAIHLHHIDPGHEPIRQEIATRLQQHIFVPAIRSDIAGEGGRLSLAQEIDARHHRGMPPYAVYVARTIFLHSLAFNEPLKGLSPDHLRYSCLGPATDISFIDEACRRFREGSAYLDDRPAAPLRFMAEANLTQLLRRAQQAVAPADVRAQLNSRIRDIFKGSALDMLPFPGGPFDVPDEVNGGRPFLVVLSYDGCQVGPQVDTVPDLIARIFLNKGAEGTALRGLRNNLIFVVAEDAMIENMRQAMARRLALGVMKTADRLVELAEHQQAKLREMDAGAETLVAIAIQQCYRHVFYPSKSGSIGAAHLAHTSLSLPAAAEKPGAGQQQIVRQLRDQRKIRAPEDEPDAPNYIRDSTPLKNGQITTAALREEFRRDPNLPMLLGDDTFLKGIRLGVEQGAFVYRRGDLLFGRGDPTPTIITDEQAVVFTAGYAAEHRIWPRPAQPAVAAHIDNYVPAMPLVARASETLTGALVPGPDAQSRADPPREPRPLAAEGILREALIRLFEQAHAARVTRLATLSIRMFDATDAFRLLAAVAALRGPDQKRVTIEAEYETAAGSSLTAAFNGTLQDAQPVKEFLEAQLRAAPEKHVSAVFRLTYADGLAVEGEAADRLVEQLTRFATGAAYVEATAEALTAAGA